MSFMFRSMKWIVAATVVAGVSGVGAVGSAQLPSSVSNMEDHKSSLAARIVLLDGTSRTLTLEGVGCPIDMCSRVVVNSRSPGDAHVTKTWLDRISAIQDITKGDALFMFKDGTEQRLSVVPLNRVLYLINESGRRQKVDLVTVRSVGFLSPDSE